MAVRRRSGDVETYVLGAEDIQGRIPQDLNGTVSRGCVHRNHYPPLPLPSA